MFQSTRPHGARPAVVRRGAPPGVRFNPRARTGRDPGIRVEHAEAKEFQSTRPHGARPCGGRPEDPPDHVSIHAPARGATAYFTSIDSTASCVKSCAKLPHCLTPVAGTDSGKRVMPYETGSWSARELLGIHRQLRVRDYPRPAAVLFSAAIRPSHRTPKAGRAFLFRIAPEATRSTVPRGLQLSSLLHVERGDAS